MHWIDPDSLSPLQSKVARFLFNPKGEADGMLLANGTEAHFPPHLSAKVLKKIRVGDAVTLYGVKPRAADMIACVAIDTAEGDRIDDTGLPAKAKKKQGRKGPSAEDGGLTRVELDDTIKRLLHGPRGEVRGVLLSGGQIVRFPPHAAADTGNLLSPGAFLAVRGDARSVADTIVVEARAWGRARTRMKSLATRPHH
jgi:hypothetical protein